MKIPVGELMRCMGLMITGAENSTPYLKYLNIKKLDFTVDSLKYIDEYLLKIRKIKKKLNNDEILLIIVRCGTYLGEVVRKPNPKKFSWMTYESACKVGGKFIKSLKLPYFKKIKEFIKDNEVGIEEKFKTICPACGTENSYHLSLGHDFLKLPESHKQNVLEECFLLSH